MASLGIPGLDVLEIPAKQPRNSPQAASWRSERTANTGPQTPPGWAPPEGVGGMPADKTMRWAQSIQQGAAKFAEGPSPNGITEGAKTLASSIRDASTGATKTAANLGTGVAKRIPLGGVVGLASEVLPHSGVYTNGSDIPWQDRMRIGASDAMAAGGGFLGGAAGVGIGQMALPIPGVGAVAGGVAGGTLGAMAGRWAGNKLFDSDGALQRAGYDPSRGVVDIGQDLASGKSLEEAMAPTMRAPIAPQRPAAPGLSGIGAVKDAQTPAPTSFADGAGGRFGSGLGAPFKPNQVTPTGPGLVGQAPTTFAEGSDRGGLTIRPNPVASPAANSTPAASFRANSDGQPMPPNPAGTIRRVGNSYEGSNIKFGADINDPRNPRVGVTSLDTSEGRRQDAMELQRMRDARSAPSVTTGDGGSTLGQGPIGIGEGGGSGELRGRRAERANAVALAYMREQGENLRSQRQIDATMRGQDMTYGGHMLSVQQAQAAAQRAQANTDREYQRATGNDDFSRQSTAQADHDKWANTTFTTDVDGKTVPDVQKIGDFNNTAQATVGALVAQLRQSGDPASIAKANKLAGQGLAGLDAEDRALMKQLYDRRDRHMQTRGAGPGSGSGPVSNNLFDYALTGRTKGLVQNTVQMRGGQSIPENDLRYTQPANRLLPDWFKTPTTALGPTPQEERRMRTGSN